MKITIKKVPTSKASGTSLCGYIKTKYDTLVRLLGEPNGGPSGDSKVNSEWVLDINGTICTIYNWKTKSTPMDMYQWHVGGKGVDVLSKLENAIGIPAIPFSC